MVGPYRMTLMGITIPPVDENLSDADVHFLEDNINQYNVETTKIGDGRPLSFLLRDERADIIAGLYGWTCGGTCEIRYLWVREDFRKRGYGKALMEATEREAIVRGCNQIVLDTHSFQAPLFYQRFGFEVMASHADYPRGHYKHYLRKKLAR
jgi:GNAT superfamily N-acetyltransferase